MKKTGADEIIVEEVNNGKLYIGESAGAMIVSENIKYAGLMDDGTEYISELKNLNSLNLVDFYTVPHYGCFPFEESAEKTMSAYSSLNLVPITNNQAILVDEDKIDVLEIKKQKLFSK
jgi:peptidase, S51 family